MSKHKITMIFEDGRSEVIEADENDTIYMAALRNKVRLMTDCLEGACATCKGQIVSGQYSMDDYSDEALTDEEASAGEALTCQMHAQSDCVIEFPYESKIAFRTEPKCWDCRIASLEKVSSNVVRLDLSLNDGEDAPPDFMPGQYVNLTVPGTDQARSYSFANPPFIADRFSFYIKMLDQGAMSDYLRDRAAEGDSISMTGPYGRFYLRAPERPIVMVAGGTGLAPMLSMLDHLAAAEITDQPVHLLYGANDLSELFGLNQIANYTSQNIDIICETSCVEAGADWSGATGHVTELLRPELIEEGADVYLCGPPPMIDAAESWLTEQGVDPKSVHAEKFLPS